MQYIEENGATAENNDNINPSYNEQYYNAQPYASPYMYTPGISVEQPPPANYPYTNGTPKPQTSRKYGPGAFIFAACLLIVCTLFSAAATYLVMDFRIARGDFPPATNQVILGGRPSEQPQPDEYNTAPLTGISEGVMTPQDIYDLALAQVVGISITLPQSTDIFDIQSNVPSVVGSGFIISSDGYILTNYHVIETAHTMELPISVVLHDGSSFAAETVGYEASSDVAVLKINKSGLSAAYIGDSDILRVGQTVYAVGNPFGDLVYTMTDGIVSALDRIVTVDRKSISTFQFSAAVNSGNSGGPVYNTNGEVVGIVTAKVIRGNVEGIGFAIPINDAIDIATALIEYGYISGRPLLGITAQTVSYAQADYHNMVVGVYVRSVNTGSAAENAGIQVGDIITAIDEEDVDSMDALKNALRKYSAGDTATIAVWREGETSKLTVIFDEDMNAGRPVLTPPPTPDSPNPFG